MGRVTIEAINCYQEPSFRSDRITRVRRDEIIWLYDEFNSPYGPLHNPKWYRIESGYIHSAYIQRVELQRINIPLRTIPKDGILGEITVPYTPTFRILRNGNWIPLYRLYYGSVHWITGIEVGPENDEWYRLTDHRINVDYYIRAKHVRPIPAAEYHPLSPYLPPEEKLILISISDQTLRAYEGEKVVLQTKISSGLHDKKVEEGEIPTDTPIGNFYVLLKMPSRHMGDGVLTDELDAYELPGVPWTMVFHELGYALHGTYWHNNFGTPMSHGCVNLRTSAAKWLFRWANPYYLAEDYYKRGRGTRVRVVK
jgi:hypothetical protein